MKAQLAVMGARGREIVAERLRDLTPARSLGLLVMTPAEFLRDFQNSLP